MYDERSETMRNLQRKGKCFDTFPGGDHGSFMRQAQQAQRDWAVSVYKGLTAPSDFPLFQTGDPGRELRTRAKMKTRKSFPAVSDRGPSHPWHWLIPIFCGQFWVIFFVVESIFCCCERCWLTWNGPAGLFAAREPEFFCCWIGPTPENSVLEIP